MTLVEKANFCLDKVIEAEGGYVNNPDDRGGVTNWGITQATYEAYLDRKVTIDEMKEMTIEQAKKIYFQEYYSMYRCDFINDYRLAYALFDQIVNRGPRMAIKNLQEACNKVHGSKGLSEDGRMGDLTIQAVNECDPVKLGMTYCENSFHSYIRIVEFNSHQRQFLQGWYNRILKLQRLFWTK